MSAEPMPGRCGAKRKGSNPPHYCEAYPVRGSGVTTGRPRCKVHGGLTPSGSASPHWVHGRFSKETALAGGKLAEHFASHANDPEYVSVRPELALIRTRLSELVERAKNGNLTDRDWNKITNIADTVARVTRVELKKLELESQVLTHREAFALVSAIQQAVLDEVQDVDVRRRIGQRVRSLLTTSGMMSAPVIHSDNDNPLDGPIAVIEPPHGEHEGA